MITVKKTFVVLGLAAVLTGCRSETPMYTCEKDGDTIRAIKTVGDNTTNLAYRENDVDYVRMWPEDYDQSNEDVQYLVPFRIVRDHHPYKSLLDSCE